MTRRTVILPLLLALSLNALPGCAGTGFEEAIDGFSKSAAAGGTLLNSPPVAGGALEANTITATSITLSWPAASDDTTDTADLEYRLFMSATGPLDTITEIEAASALTDWTAAMLSGQAASLTSQTAYLFNVLVRDTNGEITAYAPLEVTTSDTSGPAVVSISPNDGSRKQTVNTDITLTFDTALDSASLGVNTSSTACSGSLQVSEDDFASCVKLLPVSLSTDDLTVTLDPVSNLTPGKLVRVRATTGVLDINANALAAEYTSAGFYTVAAWNDANYTTRAEVTLDGSQSALPAGYTMTIQLDTRTCCTEVTSATGDDVRIFWQPTDGPAVELNRIGDAWDNAATNISYKLQSEIPAGATGPVDGYYYVYYGYVGAGAAPADDDQIYPAASSFNDADSTTIGDGWSEWQAGGGASFQLTSGALELCGSDVASPDNGLAKDIDLITTDFSIHFDMNINGDTENQWVIYFVAGDSTTMTSSDKTAGIGPGFYYGEGDGWIPANATRGFRYDPTVATYIETDPTVPSSFSVEMRVDVSAETWDFFKAGALAYSNAPWVNSGVTIDQLRIGLEQFGCGSAVTIDNFRVELNVDTPAAPATGPEETP